VVSVGVDGLVLGVYHKLSYTTGSISIMWFISCMIYGGSYPQCVDNASKNVLAL